MNINEKLISSIVKYSQRSSHRFLPARTSRRCLLEDFEGVSVRRFLGTGEYENGGQEPLYRPPEHSLKREFASSDVAVELAAECLIWWKINILRRPTPKQSG